MKDLVNRKLAEVQIYINDHPDDEIIVDVYGFSRGAAEARDFINEFNTSHASLDGSAIGFVGLFDTVASEGLANQYNYNLNLDLNKNSAEQILQLTARDEVRANFPLESLAGTAGITEWSMLGVHSDIGGGYGESTIKNISTCQNNLIANNYLHVDMRELA